MPAAPAPTTLPYLLTEVEVRRVERVSPSFVRLELGSPELADLGPEGALLDQRFKLLVAGRDGALPRVGDLLASGGDWWGAWQRLPEQQRGAVRTYTIRRRLGSGEATRIEVDVVVHGDADSGGPGNRWALEAREGDRALALAPRRGCAFGGIEWAPGAARRLLLAGDETALPAIRGILRDLPDHAWGTAVVELPTSADVPDDVRCPDGVDLHLLPRDGAPRGQALQQVVLEALAAAPDHAAATLPAVDDAEIDPDLWETPAYSSSGEDLVEPTPTGPHPDLYAWIAGESRVVTGLRRVLVNEIGLERHQVAFMGYWRDGVAMRS